MVKIKSRVLCALLAFSIFISTSVSMCFDSYATGGDIIIGGAAVSAGEAVAFLLGVFGLTAASAAVYDNVDSIKAWGNEQLETFTADTVGKLADPNAQATARADIVTWVENARKGLIDNSSVVWSYWTQWVTGLTQQATSGSSPGADVGSGIYYAGNSYSFTNDLRCFVASSSSGIYYSYYVYSGRILYCVFLSNYDFECGSYYLDEGMSSYSSHNTIFDKKHSVYYEYWDCTSSSLDGVSNTSLDEVLDNFSSIVDVPSDYTLSPTGLSDVYERDHSYDNVGLVNPGAVAGNPGITIDWGKVGDIAGVLGGIAAGELDGTEALDRAGVTVVDRVTDKVIDDTGVTDIPITDVVVDTTAIDDYTIPGLQTLFPFCLPFDLIDFLNILSAPPEAPHFQIPIRYPTGSGWAEYIVDVDLSAFDNVAMILRNMELLAFIVGLIILTRDKMIRG
ncbi:hypothetical protein [Enterocloster asparagiformis]|uniref:hypothetical protein n=1 Tax=Enterocloster asparagiformis TaxID=333367 RepID=UPI000463A083|nr:hypothetical protein [Enterocloster asparagiformis]